MQAKPKKKRMTAQQRVNTLIARNQARVAAVLNEPQHWVCTHGSVTVGKPKERA